VDVITCDKLFSDKFRDVDSVRVKNDGFPLTKPMAVNTGLRNCVPVIEIMKVKILQPCELYKRC